MSIDKKINLKDWGETWYADYKTQVQPSTYSGYRYTLNLIEAHLGGKNIKKAAPKWGRLLLVSRHGGGNT